MKKIKKRNGTITTVIITGIMFIYAALLIAISFIKMPDPIKIILILILCLGSFLLSGFLFRFQFKIYDYLNRNVDMIYNKLSYEYIPVYLNTDYLNQSNRNLDLEKNYMAKLENDGTITLRIKNNDNTETFEEQTSDYYWFLKMFRFEK